MRAQQRKKAYVTIEDILLMTITPEKISNFSITKGTDEFSKLDRLEQAKFVVEYQAAEARRWLKETRLSSKMES
jgi:hypothetical protein